MEWADYVTSMKMYNEAVANDNNWNQQIKQSVINAWSNAFDTGNYGPYNDVFPQVDWWDELVKPGFSQQYNVNISGGTNFMRYFASIGYKMTVIFMIYRNRRILTNGTTIAVITGVQI